MIQPTELLTKNRGVLVDPANGWTFGDMEDAFALIEDPSDWRARIEAVIPMDKLLVCQAACEFFTGTHLVCATPVEDALRTGSVRVTAVGYREGPAGP